MALKELYTELERHLIFKKEFNDDDYKKRMDKYYEQKLTGKELITKRFLRLELTLSDLFWEMTLVKNAKELEETLDEFENMIHSELLGLLRRKGKDPDFDTKDNDDKYNLIWERMKKRNYF
ncbi:hypothetical protein OJ967_25845 [Peribacillus frigoritolerans]|uniref:hypothetical protein n=1 Tax=Peribacillus frigoritolerans TaxID=450367 RepID=UPI0022260536|nr:hypothetical protein [Peribacillus frigoritolerans]UYY98727.1 hypothetical protein OJ967_25845 [Peribacillus frigoritolerans]